MPRAEPWFWRWMERPWRTLALAQVAVGGYIALGVLLVLRPEQDLVAQLRQDIERCESENASHGQAQDGLLSPERLDEAIGRLSRRIAAGEKLRRDPAAFIAAIHPGRAEKIAWQAFGAPGDPGHASDLWSLAVTTDYAGLRRILRNLASQDGARTLDALSVSRRDTRLEVELMLSVPALTEEGAKDNAANLDITAGDLRNAADDARDAGDDRAKTAPERDPFQPAPVAQAAPRPGSARQGEAAGPIGAIKGKVGAGGRWLFWTVDGQGRWRRLAVPRPPENQDHDDHNEITQ
ncbi:hypothetical protein [Acerihabitans arboris]|uniref:Uncharacterized protein n=1 Tax=Acerihabitans arboris TaxID=2691583 RepID=A0A845SMN1_9GAMM|nr:hypothetical protein [Acerihabitans arboris]NDL64477.1 hypothetical protein [Acerihabitans arboris]